MPVNNFSDNVFPAFYQDGRRKGRWCHVTRSHWLRPATRKRPLESSSWASMRSGFGLSIDEPNGKEPFVVHHSHDPFKPTVFLAGLDQINGTALYHPERPCNIFAAESCQELREVGTLCQNDDSASAGHQNRARNSSPQPFSDRVDVRGFRFNCAHQCAQPLRNGSISLVFGQWLGGLEMRRRNPT